MKLVCKEGDGRYTFMVRPFFFLWYCFCLNRVIDLCIPSIGFLSSEGVMHCWQIKHEVDSRAVIKYSHRRSLIDYVGYISYLRYI